MASTTHQHGGEDDSAFYFCLTMEMDVSHRSFGHLVSDLAVCLVNFALMVIGIVANVLALFAYKRNKALQTPSNYLLAILSTFDVLLALTGQPLFIVWKVLEIAGGTSCAVYIGLVFSVNFFAAVSFLVASLLISLERYYSVFYPSLHRNHANKAFFRLVVIITVLVWTVLIVGSLVGNLHRLYFAVAAAVVIFCLLGTAICYIRIFREISRRCPEHCPVVHDTTATHHDHRHDQEDTSTDHHHHKAKISRGHARTPRGRARTPHEKSTLYNMIFIVGTMTVFYAPIGGCALYALLIGRDWVYMNYFMPWAYLFVFASTAINPFMYGWKSRAIRRSIKGVLRNAFDETTV